MESGAGLGLAAVVAVLGGLVLLVVLVVFLVARGPARAGLSSLAVAAALVGPVVGIGAASYSLSRAFSAWTFSGSGGTAVILAACAEVTTLYRAGCAAAALTLILAVPLAWIGRGDRPPLAPASPRRLAVLALPALLAPLLVGGALEYSRGTRDLVVEVVTDRPAPAPAADGEAAGDSEPPRRLAMGIAETSARLAAGVSVGMLGVPWLCLVLLGLAAATAVLAWRVQVPPAFAAGLSAWMLLQALLWVGAIFLLRMPAAA